MNWGLNTLLLVIGAVLVVLELILGAATGFDLLLVGVSLAGGGAVGLITGNEMLGVLVAVALLLLNFIVGRRQIKKWLAIKSDKTNVDAVIGSSGIVSKEIRRGESGQVILGNETWRAEGHSKVDTLEKGEKIKVVSISGVTVKVAKE